MNLEIINNIDALAQSVKNIPLSIKAEAYYGEGPSVCWDSAGQMFELKMSEMLDIRTLMEEMSRKIDSLFEENQELKERIQSLEFFLEGEKGVA